MTTRVGVDRERLDAFLAVARLRRSVRNFEPGRRVAREDLLAICEAGRWAPSGANTQPWQFIVIIGFYIRELRAHAMTGRPSAWRTGRTTPPSPPSSDE